VISYWDEHSIKGIWERPSKDFTLDKYLHAHPERQKKRCDDGQEYLSESDKKRLTREYLYQYKTDRGGMVERSRMTPRKIDEEYVSNAPSQEGVNKCRKTGRLLKTNRGKDNCDRLRNIGCEWGASEYLG
jgi:hypothetical protein